jgi:hypothetical protein
LRIRLRCPGVTRGQLSAISWLGRDAGLAVHRRDNVSQRPFASQNRRAFLLNQLIGNCNGLAELGAEGVRTRVPSAWVVGSHSHLPVNSAIRRPRVGIGPCAVFQCVPRARCSQRRGKSWLERGVGEWREGKQGKADLHRQHPDAPYPLDKRYDHPPFSEPSSRRLHLN